VPPLTCIRNPMPLTRVSSVLQRARSCRAEA